jgi:LmbE family N-acetylglucosaminyl deacetylase
VNKQFTILGIFAHPDDETFGPGATLAKYAAAGNKVALITATRGQAGQTSGQCIEKDLGLQREAELRSAAHVLGITDLTILDFFDGTLNEHQLPLMKKLIATEADRIQPDVVITHEPSGISMHLDHIAVHKAVVQLYDEERIKPQKLYYFGIPRELMRLWGRTGGIEGERIARIDTHDFQDIKKKAMHEHRTQRADVERILGMWEQVRQQGIDSTYDTFALARTTLSDPTFPEKDLLTGL